MMKSVLTSKIYGARVTSAEIEYEGSIKICPNLIAESGLSVYEKVLVANMDNGNRFETYVIEGELGEMGLNGAAARLGKKGDKVIIMAFSSLNSECLKNFKPKIIKVNEVNEII